MSIAATIKRKAEVKDRARKESWEVGRCRVLGCGGPARAATDDGLDHLFCRSHAEQYARHGSPYRKSYSASQVGPYRVAASAWLKANKDDAWVRNSLDRVRGLYSSAGSHVEAFRLRGLTPQERANVAWARLRKAGVDPFKVVAAALAIEMIIHDDPQADRKVEFKQVQAAKLVHRMASGTHKRYGDGAAATELHVYPRSRGRVLRHIGKMALEVCELIVDHHGASLPRGPLHITQGDQQ